MMWVVVITDTALVLYLAGARNVLSKLEPTMSPVLILHIFLAVGVIIGYFFSAYWGVKLSQGDESYRNKMIWADKIIIPARILVFITIVYIKMNV